MIIWKWRVRSERSFVIWARRIFLMPATNTVQKSELRSQKSELVSARTHPNKPGAPSMLARRDVFMEVTAASYLTLVQIFLDARQDFS